MTVGRQKDTSMERSCQATTRVLTWVGFLCMPVYSIFRRIHSRRGGDACIAHGGSILSPVWATQTLPDTLHPPGRPQGSPPRSTPPPPLQRSAASRDPFVLIV